MEMSTDEMLIDELIKVYESVTGWGSSKDWKNQDFITLSEKIQEKTGEAISHVTLKRIWGRVKYDSLPNSHTLDTLVKYIGYENWREFRIKKRTEHIIPVVTGTDKTVDQKDHAKKVVLTTRRKPGLVLAVTGILICIVLAALIVFPAKKEKHIIINPKDYSFSSKKVVTSGLPNSVVFDYDATKAPGDSVAIQQSWDRKLRVNVSKNDHQHTAVYYYPDFYYAKLIVNNQIVKQHELLIKSNGWLSLVAQSPVPVYFDNKDAIVDGKLGLSADKIQARNVKMQPSPPSVFYCNVNDFGEIYSDDFVFETSIRNDYHEGAAACQKSQVYLLCKGTAIWVPLCSKGCVSDLDLLFTGYYISGKDKDLSVFGVDFNKYIKLKIVSHKGKAQIFLDNKLAYSIEQGITRSKIIGFYYQFQGTGSVDYVRLSNEKTSYDDEFDSNDVTANNVQLKQTHAAQNE